jgi:nucleoside-diphosphate-sugar epimerase
VNFVDGKLRTFDTTESWVADISKLKDKYGYFPKYSLEYGLNELHKLKIGG